MNIGLTGGMGCGKSTALGCFRNRGITVFESDRFVRDAFNRNQGLIDGLIEVFGMDVIDDEGRVDRARLASIVFSDTSKLDALEALVHPLVRAAWQEEVRSHQSCLVVEIPLLFEKSLEHSFDTTICVALSASVQRQRLLERGMTEDDIQRRLARQWTLEEKMQKADIVLMNDGSIEHLQAQVDMVLSRLAVC